MWKKVELKPKEGLFLMNNGLYIYPDKNINEKDRDKIIGYCLDDSRIISINSSKNPISWSTRYDKISGLINYGYDYRYTGPYNDLEGRYNTNRIIEFCRMNSIDLQSCYPATYYCKSFSPGYKDSEWYFPSTGEMKLFYDNREKFRKLCRLIRLGTNMNSDSLGAYYFWTNTQCEDPRRSWYLSFYCSSILDYDYKKYRCYVVPFLKMQPYEQYSRIFSK
jgi:hypothetical protein